MDMVANAGRYVGERNGVVWMCYGDDWDFRAMTVAFAAAKSQDRVQVKASPGRTMSQWVGDNFGAAARQQLDERVSLAQRVLQLVQAHADRWQPLTLGALMLRLGCAVAEIHAAVLALRRGRLVRTGHWTLSQDLLSRQPGAAAVLPEHGGCGQGAPEYTWYVERV